MKINIRTIILLCGLSVMTGCIGYAPPYQHHYGMPYAAAPYGGYGYGVAPAPVYRYGRRDRDDYGEHRERGESGEHGRYGRYRD